MAKKPNKANSRRNKASNTTWLQENLERTTLDLEALASMSIDEVQDDLKAQKATSHADFMRSLNEKLPQNVAIKSSVPAPKKTSQTFTRLKTCNRSTCCTSTLPFTQTNINISECDDIFHFNHYFGNPYTFDD